MNWLKRKIRRWINDVDEDAKLMNNLKVRESDSLDSEPILNFRVFSAVGGRVVEFRHYDRQTDRSHSQTYIITNDQDFGERISKIATMEILKQ